MAFPYKHSIQRLLMRILVLSSINVYLALAVAADSLAQTTTSHSHWNRMLAVVQARVDRQPNDSENWRLLGKTKTKLGDVGGAISSLQRAIELDDSNAAAHHDLADLYEREGSRDQAAVHFARVYQIAPDSEYARAIPSWWRPPPDESVITQASFEINRLDSSGEANRLRERIDAQQFDPGLPRYFFFMEAGVQFNSNVTFTPISQELFAADAESWQAFINPDLEYRIHNGETWRHGPQVRLFLTANERRLSDFNLQSYHGGYFGEHVRYSSNAIWTSRVEYGYTYDLLGGSMFGNRNALRLSETAIWNAGHVTSLFCGTHWSDFVGDGVNPTVDSLDGWTNTFGISHLHTLNRRWLKSMTIGADVELADIEGADYRYNGVALFADATIPIRDCLSLVLEGGWGYRDYYAFTSTPSRNETIWRGGSRLKYAFNDWLSFSAVMNYDRFDSENTNFSADRWVAGFVTTIVK